MTQHDLLQALIDYTNDHGYLPVSADLHEFYSRFDVPVEIQFQETIHLAVFYMEQVFELYQEQRQTAGLQSELPFAQAFSFLIFSTADILEEHRFFSVQCLDLTSTGWFYPSYNCRFLEPEFRRFLLSDSQVSNTAHVLTGDWFTEQLIRDWEHLLSLRLKEELDVEGWTERVDKYAVFIESLLHSDIGDKGFDYFKMVFNQEFQSLKSLFSFR